MSVPDHAGPYRSTLPAPPTRRRDARRVALALTILALLVALFVALRTRRHGPPAVPVRPPPRHGPPAYVLARLDPLTDGLAVYSNGLDLCVRTASGEIYCDTRSPDAVPSVRDPNRYALARYQRPTPFAQIAWSSEPGPWMLHIFDDGPNAPIARRLAGVANTPWTLATDGLVRQVRTVNSGTRVLPRVTHATALETQGSQLCALTAQGEVWCWLEQSGVWPPTIHRVTGLRGAHDLVVLDRTGCAIVDGGLFCWDLPETPQANDVSNPLRASPRGAANLTRLVGSCWRGCRLCALTADHNVRCGTPAPGQLLDDPLGATLPGERGAQDLAMHGDGACALMFDGHMRCWSHDASFALQGAVRERSRFAAVVGLPPARQIAVSATHACAVTLDGRAHCWGANTSGQVEASGYDHPTPVRAGDPTTLVAQVGVGDGFSCALSVDGALACWGAHNGAAPSPLPDRFTSMTVSRSAVCARNAFGIVHCQRVESLVGVARLVDTHLGALTELTAMGDGFCAFDARDALVCWTLSSDGHAIAARPAVRDLVALIAHSGGDDCGVQRDDRIVCWRDGTPRAHDALQRPADVTQTVSNRWMFAMRRGDGRVRFVGQDADVPELVGVTSLAMADGLICALHEDGSVSCAGNNDRGQLGDGSPSPGTPADAVISRSTP